MGKNKTGAANTAPADNIQESYDEFPYESYVYPQTHPERLYTIASLFNLKPPPIETARILEIGGAGGGNVIPLAMLYPKTKIVSFDLSPEQIAQANEFKKAMKLKNIEFIQRDLTKLEKDLGEFDYIICHGVFSWVPPVVRDEIFKVCRRHLSKNGLAVISYNVLPGWSAIKSLREMMLYHASNFESPAEKIREAKNLLGFLYENTNASNEAYRKIIERERNILNTTNDSYIFHEHLECENHQYYLHQFVDMARENKLAYVGDTEISSMYLGNFNEKVRETLGQITDVVRQEQYIDFLSNRRFRHSIITREENASQMNRSIDSSRILDFHVQARFKPVESEDKENAKFVWVDNSEANFSTSDKNTAIVLKALAAKNRPVDIAKFSAEVEKEHGIPAATVKEIFHKSGFALTLQNFLSLHLHDVEFATTISAKPKAFAWTRHQAIHSPKNFRTLTNIKRESVTVPPFLKTLISHLDGKQTHEQIVEKLVKDVLGGELKIHRADQPVTDENEIREIVKQQLPAALQHLAYIAVLEA